MDLARASRADLERPALRPRMRSDASVRDLSTNVIGTRVPLPLALSPTGLAGRRGWLAIKHGADCALEKREVSAAAPLVAGRHGRRHP